ncbi:MAG TPA: M12 family metallo-peptidase, partial [Anaerolineales bacterium]
SDVEENMMPSRISVALAAAGMTVMTFIALLASAPSLAQPSGCYKACQIPASSVAAPRYVACLGVRDGATCSVCPGQQSGQSLQILTNKNLSCFKACANGFAWNAQARQCCSSQTSGPVTTDNADLIIAPGTRGSRVRVLFRALQQYVLSSIALPMTRAEKWSVRKQDVEAVKKAAAGRGFLVIELGADSDQIMRDAPSDTQLTEQQKVLVDRAKTISAATSVKVLIGPHPAVLEHALIGDANCPTEPVKIAVPLGGGGNKGITRTNIEIKGDKAIWRGPLDESDVPVTLIWWPNGRMAGTAQHRGHLYSIRHLGGSIYAVVEMSEERMPAEHAPAPPRLRRNDPNLRDDPLPKQGGGSVIRTAESTRRGPTEARKKPATAKSPEPRRSDIVIDLIVAYTPKAAANYNDITRELIELAVEEGNESFRMSGLGHIKLRLVHAYKTNYVEEGAHFDHVWRFADKGDGYMEEVHDLRNKFRADVGILIVDDPQGCGLATRVHADADEAFAVVHHGCAASTYTLAHEIGHLIGARHDLAIDKALAPFPYGHGYVNGTKWRDIMSYKESCGGCPRLPVWSSPNVQIKGEPAGTPDLDNARVILEQAARVAAFR